MTDLDAKESILEHRDIINKKIFLKNIYVDFYKKLKTFKLPKNGLLVEIGSGGGFLKKFIPRVVTTDVLVVKGIDKKLDLEKTNLKSKSVAAFYMLNVFHHIKNPKRALGELERCLVEGGKVIMIEPWPTFFSKVIYHSLHHEELDTNSGWFIKGKGRMSDANMALPWIIFERDRVKFNKLYPNLKIEAIVPHTPFKYLVSGGLSHPQFLPIFLYPALSLFEWILTPFNRFIAMFATIVVTKITSQQK